MMKKSGDDTLRRTYDVHLAIVLTKAEYAKLSEITVRVSESMKEDLSVADILRNYIRNAVTTDTRTFPSNALPQGSSAP